MENNLFLGRITGMLFLLTFASAIPPVAIFYAKALNDPNFVLGDGGSARISWGAIFELVLIFSNISTALALYPVLNKRFPGLALGYVAARLVECGFIATGIVALLALDTLRVEAAREDPAMLLVMARGLVSMHEWTFRLGPGVVVGIGNGLLLGFMLWKTRLVPRAMSIFGIFGGPLLVVAGILVILGQMEAGGGVQLLLTLPEIIWEFSLGLWLSIRGFSRSSLLKIEQPCRSGMPD
jgi:hypothetical protein